MQSSGREREGGGERARKRDVEEKSPLISFGLFMKRKILKNDLWRLAKCLFMPKQYKQHSSY